MTQLIPDITGVIVDAIIAICGLIFTGVFIPWVKQTGIPWLKEKRLYNLASLFVKAAEKQTEAGTLTTPKLEYVMKRLEEKGYQITPEVRAVIEAAVKDLDIAVDGAIGVLGDVFVEEEATDAEQNT